MIIIWTVMEYRICSVLIYATLSTNDEAKIFSRTDWNFWLNHISNWDFQIGFVIWILWSGSIHDGVLYLVVCYNKPFSSAPNMWVVWNLNIHNDAIDRYTVILDDSIKTYWTNQIMTFKKYCKFIFLSKKIQTAYCWSISIDLFQTRILDEISIFFIYPCSKRSPTTCFSRQSIWTFQHITLQSNSCTNAKLIS